MVINPRYPQNPLMSYLVFRQFSGFGAWPDITECAAKANDCPGCLACCSSTYPTVKGAPDNVRKKKRCILRCQLKFGAACSGGPGPAPAPTGSPTCGIVCTGSSGPVGSEYGQCHYDCGVPASQIPAPGPGTTIPVQNYPPSNVIYPIGSTNVVDTSTDQPIVDTGSTTGIGILDSLMAHPILYAGLAVAGVIAYRKFLK